MQKRDLPPETPHFGLDLNNFLQILKEVLPGVVKAFPFFGPLYQLISTSLNKRPKTTAAVLLLVVGSFLSALILTTTEENRRQEVLRQRNASYTVQMDELNKIGGSLENLLNFVNQQKESLSESQTAIERLKKEEQQLRPVVEADRKLVEAVLASRSQADSRAAWKERAIGFAIGLISSFLASLLFEYMRRSRASRA